MPPDLRLPRILITNDDGIDAPGLKILEEIAANYTDELWVIAPSEEKSGASQALTLGEPIKFDQRGERRFAVRGTPSDCVMLAISHFMKDAKPSLLLSGINRGTNHGDAVLFSGTVGAAQTGLMYDIPSIAISQTYQSRDTIRWDTSRIITPKLLDYFLAEGWKKDTCLSLNIPDLAPENVTGLAWARQTKKSWGPCKVDVTEAPRGGSYAWLSLTFSDKADLPDSEYATLQRGKVSAVAISLDRSIEVLKSSVKFWDSEPVKAKDYGQPAD